MQCLRHVKIRPPSQEAREVFLDLRQREVRVSPSRFELDEHIDVAISPEVIPKHGAEQGQPMDVMAAAEVGDQLVGDGDASLTRRHGAFRLSMAWVDFLAFAMPP